jgi:hypothetical protein
VGEEGVLGRWPAGQGVAGITPAAEVEGMGSVEEALVASGRSRRSSWCGDVDAAMGSYFSAQVREPNSCAGLGPRVISSCVLIG